MDNFLGHDIEYWIELEKKAKILAVTKWLEEISTLRAKVSFYESRIKELDEFMNLKK